MKSLHSIVAKSRRAIALIVGIVITLAIIITSFYNLNTANEKITHLNGEEISLKKQLQQAQSDFNKLKSEDQFVRNEKLQKEINDIQSTFKKTSTTYESLVELKTQLKNTDKLDASMASIIKLLSDRNYSSAEAELTALNASIQIEKNKLVVAQIPQNVTQNNTAPASGYSRQAVSALGSSYLVDIVAADLNSTRVIVDTASDGTCANDCPVLALGDYVSRSGGYAGVNGSYFCPASYPSCTGKTNSFDTLLMNKNKVYFNSDNNVYSTVPVVIFNSTSVRYALSQEWGRDTGVDAVIANQPLLVSNGNVVFGGDDEVKRLSKGSRSFVGSSGSTAYIGVMHNVNAAEMARVLQTMGIQNALNLDSGGSTALWDGGYKVGPGRNIPNAVLFVRK